MKPTDILSAEHRIIEQVLDSLEALAQKALAEQKLDGESAKQAVDFFRNFADKCHHGKEEVHLFPMMESKGFSRDNGPTGVMVREHEIGRDFVGTMDKNIDAASQGDSGALVAFVNNATGYVQMLREHIQKEDHCLFSMANNAMTAEDQKHLQELFDHVEAVEMGEGTHDKYLDIAKTLTARFGIELDVPEGAKTCCHHH